MSENQDTVLEVNHLKTCFHGESGVIPAVDDVSWSLERGRTLALVGESGCGKTVSALSVMRLVAQPAGRIVGGQILLRTDGREQDLAQLAEPQMRKIRGSRIAMIFQEPMTSLNPVFTIGDQIAEAVQLHENVSRQEAWSRAVEMLKRVGIPDPARRAEEYPHQMSGGMRQRVMIAMALSCNPDMLIADEPTTALDVTIQAQILDLLAKLQAETGMSILLITHDLGVVAQIAHRVAVMYASKIVEMTDVNTLFAEPLHPYTQGLFKSVPRLGAKEGRLATIPGTVPNPAHFPPGCKFHPRCPLGHDDKRCQTAEPRLLEVKPGHWVSCWKTAGYEEMHRKISGSSQ
jgi:oligopeptide/dipeptide ABC transporter ATP-binding protein